MPIINSGMNELSDIPVADRWRALRERADISMEKVAKKLGYKAASGIQRYENPEEFKKPYLPMDFVRRLIPILEPLKISRDELYRLAGVPEELLDGSRGLNDSAFIMVLIAVHAEIEEQACHLPPETVAETCVDIYRQFSAGGTPQDIANAVRGAVDAAVRRHGSGVLPSELDA